MLVLVILMGRSRLLVMRMVMIVIMGMAVRQIPVRMLVIMLDHGRRSFSP